MSECSVDLASNLMTFVDFQVRSGRHRDASEVVGEALRRYEGEIAAEMEQASAIREVIEAGRQAIARGDYASMSSPADDDELTRRLTRQTLGEQPDQRAC